MYATCPKRAHARQTRRSGGQLRDKGLRIGCEGGGTPGFGARDAEIVAQAGHEGPPPQPFRTSPTEGREQPPKVPLT
eukprot:1310252-Prymnesium_polylepis.1